MSMLQMARDLDVQYKTAFVLCHKLREAIAAERSTGELDGEVEVDGMYVGGHIRPANHVENRVDRRKAEHQTGKRRVVVAFRQRKGRTLPFVTRTEAEGVALAIENVDRMAVLHADEASHWDHLHDGWQVGRINHSESYSDNGVCTNQVESYFSRSAPHDRWSAPPRQPALPAPVREPCRMAGRSPPRKQRRTGKLVRLAMRPLQMVAMAHPVSRNWKGYWQRDHTQAYLRA
jgi:hypothetical protein